MWWDTDRGEAIFAKANVHVVLQVLDQFGTPLVHDNTTVVSATMDPTAAGVLEGIRSNTSVAGRVELHYLRFSHHGDFDVHFSIGGNRVQTLRVVVSPHEDDGFGPTGKCGKEFFERLSSFALPPSSVNASQVSVPSSALYDRFLVQEQVAYVSFPSSFEAVCSCARVLEEAGIRVVSGWGGDIWVWYRPAMEALDTGVGLPTASMDSWARLGLPASASPRDVRKAYHRQSLVWHPDRWASYPIYQRLAQDAFEVVSEAYRSLTES